MAIIVAIVLEVVVILLSVLMLFAAGMSDNPSAGISAGNDAIIIFIVGTIIAGLILWSHWWHFTW